MIRFLAGLALACTLAFAAPLLAQEVVTAPLPESVVTVEVGAWMTALRDAAITAVAGVLTYFVGKIGNQWWTGLIIGRVNQIAEKAVDFAANSVKQAVGERISIDVHNEMLAAAINYFLESAPAWIVKFAGGKDGVRDKLVARLPVPKEEAIVTPTATAPEGKRIARAQLPRPSKAG